MITANVDIEDGLVNGATGTLCKIDYIKVNNRTISNILWLKFDDSKVESVQEINGQIIMKSIILKII